MKKIYLFLFLLSFCYHVTAQNSSCDMAIPISEGGGTQSVTYVEGQKNYWYSYTAPVDKDMLLKISVPTEFGSIKLQGVASCDTPLNSYPSTASSGLEIQIPRGTSYYIVFQQPTSLWGAPPPEVEISSFEVTIKEIVLGGATCDDALVLKDGVNTIPANGSNYDYTTWVSYTPTITGRLVLTFPSSTRIYNVKRYSDCDGEATDIAGNEKMYKMSVTENVPVLLKLDNQKLCDVTVACQTVEQGDDCDNPIIAVDGDLNTCKASKIGDHWYSFTTNKSGFLVVSSCNMDVDFAGKVLLQESCSSSQKKVAGVCPEGKGFYLRYEVEAQKTYLININLTTSMTADFNFSVNVEDYQPGDKCDKPLVATKGDNPIAGVAGNYWYSYTLADPSYLEISNIGVADFAGSLYLYKDCESSYIASGSKDWTNGGVSLKYTAKAGTYLVKLELTNSCNPFNLKITDTPVKQGDECDNPFNAKSGENSCIGKGTVWCSYEASKDGYLEIATVGALADFTGSFQIYTDCGAYASVRASSTPVEGGGASLKMKVDAGSIYLIKWTFSSDYPEFKFNVGESDYEPGEACSKPLSAVLGDNAFPSEKRSTYYSYTPEKDGWLVISICDADWNNWSGAVTIQKDCNSSALPVQKGTCSGNIGTTYKVEASAGNSYVICVTNNTTFNHDMSFTLAVEDYALGDACAMPIELSSVAEPITVERTLGSTWYKFIADKDGFYTISSNTLPGGTIIIGGSGSSTIQVKTGDCSGQLISSTYTSDGYVLKVGIAAGTSVYVNIVIGQEKSGVTWSVTYKAAQEGELCFNPKKVEVDETGTTLMCPTGESSLWYAITPKKEGKLLISTCGSGNAVDEKFDFYTTCDGQLLEAEVDYCEDMSGHTVLLDVKADAVYLLNLKSYYDNAPTINVALEVAPGFDCEHLIHAASGSNVLPLLDRARDTYYSYTPEKDGWLKISLCREDWEGNVIMKTDCTSENMLVRQSACPDETGIAYKTEVTAGTAYIICITNTVTFADEVSFDLSEEDYAAGDLCSNPIEVKVGKDGTSFVCPAGEQVVWYGITPAEDGKLTVSACGETGDAIPAMDFYTTCDGEALVTVNNDCPDGFGKVVSLEEVKGNTVYLLKLIGHFGKATTIDITWQTLSSIDEGKDLSKRVFIAPNPNNGTFVIDLNAFDANRALSIEVTNVQGQTLYMEDVNSSTASDYNIHLSHLPCGMYFLKVTDGELNITEKFVVK